jgi:molybdopterin converting factor subunit 1
MRVTVRLFARLRDIAGASELTRDLAPGATIGAVWRELVGEFPELGQYERSISSAVNTDYTSMDRVLREGDEVAFLPPVSGGGPRGAASGTPRRHPNADAASGTPEAPPRRWGPHAQVKYV